MSGSLADLLHVVVVFSEVVTLLWWTLLVIGMVQANYHPVLAIMFGIPLIAFLGLIFLIG